MKLYDIVGYVYTGGVHCDDCTSKLFPRLKGVDREGNDISPYFVEDAGNSDTDTCCDTCHEMLYELN